MPDEVRMTVRERATVLAALRFWEEEMIPHGRDVMRPYMENPDVEPLTGDEIEQLCDRLRRGGIGPSADD